MKQGKVWLVGAGPGDPGLLTIKGREAIANADVIVYDALVSDPILALIPEGCRCIFAGKRSGNHFLKQDETNRVLLEEAQRGNRVVRLKGGDPFLFGRGGEELELLVEHSIPFEIIPGITSAFAVPAYNGIPVTHRDFCSSVHVITGHRRSNQSYDIDFDALVKTKGTLVFLMGIAALPDICRGLLEAGIDPDMPAAILEKGTTADQHRICAKISELESVCAETEVKTPAIIIVGKVCALAEEFAWVEKKPLHGIRVLVTRPKDRASRLSAMLRESGAEVLEIPAIRTELIQNNFHLTEAIERLKAGKYSWIVFTSPAGVKAFFDELLKYDDVRMLASMRIAVIGQGTASELRTYGIKYDFMPSVYDGETLGKELSEICDDGAGILIPRARIGNPELVSWLESKANAVVDDVAIYDTVFESSELIDEKKLLNEGKIDYALFTSASTVKGFVAAANGADFQRVHAVCIGKQTEKEAKKNGMITITAKQATLESMVHCLSEVAGRLM